VAQVEQSVGCVYVYVCLCVQTTVAFNLDDILSRYLAGWIIMSL